MGKISTLGSLARWLACGLLAVLTYAIGRATIETGDWFFGVSLGAVALFSIFGVVIAEVEWRKARHKR